MITRLFTIGVLVVGLAYGTAQAQTPGSAYAPANSTSSTAYLFGNTNARHNQLLYRAGSISGARAGVFQRIYFRYGDLNGAPIQAATLDSLTISFAQTSDTAFRKLPSQTDYVYVRNVQPAFFRSSYTIPQGTTNNWFAIDLDQPVPYDPSRSLIVDVKFKDGSNPTFLVQGKGVFTTGLYQHAYSASLTDTAGRNSNSFLHFGFDLITAAKQAKQRLALQVMPNPSAGQAVVSIPAGIAEATAEILDIAGKQVATRTYKGQSRLELPVAALAPGKYLVIVTTEKATYEASLIKE